VWATWNARWSGDDSWFNRWQWAKRSLKLLEDTTLACGVFGLLMDRAGFIEVVPAASMILRVGSRFDLDLVFHVV
jgi:hypothetical protein